VRRDIPFILLTGYGRLELEKKAFQEGAYAVVLKPVDVDVLLSVMTHAIIRRGSRPSRPQRSSVQSFHRRPYDYDGERH